MSDLLNVVVDGLWRQGRSKSRRQAGGGKWRTAAGLAAGRAH